MRVASTAKNAENRERFDVDTLRTLAGDKAFARGETYFRDGQVEIVAIEPSRVVARVSGTDDYRTALTGRGKRFEGECSCPAFEDRGWCKHLVAVALAANAAGGEAKAEGAGTLERIRGHLNKLGAAAVVEMVMGLAERDAALFRKLELAAAAEISDDKALEAALRKAIDAATHSRRFIEYGEAREWAAGVGGAIDAVEALVPQGRCKLALRLVEHALTKFDAAIQNMDDSSGYGGGLLSLLAQIHLAACRTAPPDPVALARELYNREMTETYETFYGAAAVYADVLGEVGLAEFERLATAAWEKLPLRGASPGGRHEYNGDYDHLLRVLDFFAERAGDVEKRIALRAKNLAAPWNYLQLAEFCLAHGRTQDALKHAEEGLWVFEDGRPDERLVDFAVKLLIKARRKADAEALLKRAFEKAPSFELYRSLRSAGGAEAGERAIAFLEARLAKEPASRWSSPTSLLLQILVDEKKFDKAWRIVRQQGVMPEFAEELANASEASHPAEALAVYTRRVEQLADAGGYDNAMRLVAKMAKLRGAADHAAYVAGLKERYRRKRNLMKLLG